MFFYPLNDHVSGHHRNRSGVSDGDPAVRNVLLVDRTGRVLGYYA
jgi:hypothetical protein